MHGPTASNLAPRPSSRQPSTTELLNAIAVWVLSALIIAVVPLLDQIDHEAGGLYDNIQPWQLIVVCTVVTLQSGVFLLCVRRPETTFMVVFLLPWLICLAAPSALFNASTLAVLVASFHLALRLPARRTWNYLVLGIASLLASQTINDLRVDPQQDLVPVGLLALMQAVSSVVIPVLIAQFVAARRESKVAHANELSALKRERGAIIDATVARERTAISRELHDIAAHHLSGIAMMSAAMEHLVTTDPEAAISSARHIREQSTAVLADLRKLVGLLREEAPSTRSVESLVSIEDLIAERRTSGQKIEFLPPEDIHALGQGIGPLAQMVAYRMVQEALANAARHAPGAACRVEFDPSDAGMLTIRVVNDGPTQSTPSETTGFGLLGMRERAELVGGQLVTGPLPDGGWIVDLRLNRETI